ncbi:MAG: hypothetical protein JNL83_31090 [Myxococcales bacterium]|nr:hypothetical protein [Myxococcales bacterium]
MRDDQVRRYARHILLPEVGGLGQTALMVSAAHLALTESEPEAELIAARFLVAGGVGSLAVTGATQEQIAELQSHGPDTRVSDGNDGRPIVLAPRPAWWPSSAGDASALAFWRGGLGAVRWMTDVINK